MLSIALYSSLVAETVLAWDLVSAPETAVYRPVDVLAF